MEGTMCESKLELPPQHWVNVHYTYQGERQTYQEDLWMIVQ